MSASAAKWNYPTKILFGAGRIAELAAACRETGISRPLLVTDAGLAKLPMVAETMALLAKEGVPAKLFSDIKPNPIAANVEAGVAAFRDGGHDGVIAFGGGSGLDAGKLVAFMAGQTRPIWDFEDIGDWWSRANADTIAPIVAVPTTAGTGSEVGRAAVVTDEAAHMKKIIFHPKMLPGVVIADPLLTVGLPKPVTAATGMDAFAHCMEAYCAPGYHPMADGIAMEGLRLIAEWLPVAYESPENVEARGHMMAAASMGATAFQKGLGAVHSLAHPLGALYDAHHGLLNAILMPYVMIRNRPAIEGRMDRLARYLGLEGQGFDAVLAWLLGLRRRLGIPETLSAIGIKADRAEEIGRLAENDPSTPTNAVPVTAADLSAIFRRAVAGDVS
ncbi:iron-containing alcohol dehydrogenase [Inquilinus sp. CAU 1745]|uniref:iron-containing alcohol dehydrogenase n=1 Tax=Inquilinus sp. CAU 1745 TaxID=3140369 RepID=UPI00325A66EB